MFTKLLTKIFSSRNDYKLYCIQQVVDEINQMEPYIEKLSNNELKEKTNEFRSYLKEGKTLEYLIPEAFSVVREASKRIFNMRHFDAQLLGGIVLNSRCIAEMRTGEGKTLTATLPAYLNALSGHGVHIVTVNDYLAKRDAENNRPLFEFLGLKVGINLPGMSIEDKRKAYLSDITYGTNNEYGFDYLRDNMIFHLEDKVQRKLHYALIDEVDSILIDEARTPLIISGSTEESSELYVKINRLIPKLIPQDKEDSESFQGQGHFSIDEKTRQVHLTERGLVFVENMLVEFKIMKKEESLYSSNNIILMHHVTAALKAHVLFHCNVDYLVKDGEIFIVDEHTGRVMKGRRWSDGLHQAIEAKENVTIQKENQPLATITFQNYFRLYEKLAGMTGTAKTESFEFRAIYKLDTVVVPTNRPMIRKNMPDLVYLTEKEKINAIIKDIRNRISNGQPVLVGTISIEKSEIISHALTKENIKHTVLNAKFHAMEADIIAQAGQCASVTIATNMAGRGTDIVLGGNWKTEVNQLQKPTKEQIKIIKNNWKTRHNAVLLSGGLHIIGTERHESRRIDNQLRGRAGRQGDPGSSCFYLSMEDSLMRIFTSNRISKMMRKLGMKEGEAITHPWVTKAISNAQRKVEARNFDIRKQLLEYDDVANDQRQAIYNQRNELLYAQDIRKTILNIREDVIKSIINKYIISRSMEEGWNIIGLEECLEKDFNLKISITKWLKKEPCFDEEKLYIRILQHLKKKYLNKELVVSDKIMRNIEKNIMLQTLDSLWKEHLTAMDYLREGIHLRGYAQKDPQQEYKRESFNMFSHMLEAIKYEVISILSVINIQTLDDIKILNQQKYKQSQHLINEKFLINYQNKKFTPNLINSYFITKKQYSQHDFCPCGSGKKFIQCHGRLDY
ncbi:Protein translocase subunit SecA [Candidatus Ecksteinia adelgidicola]|nr:Protein translocase subunit SecA [Candidatus Ecksteinia adelgidicola]